MTSEWLNLIKKAKKTCYSQNNLRKIHYEFENGEVMVEEYNMETAVLTRRAWRKNSNLSKTDEWDIEIGDPEPKMNMDAVLIQENSNQPFLTKRITKNNIEWRIRNLPYQIETYNVEANKEKNLLVVRTTNKKYFKEISIPELKRVNLQPDQNSVSISHKYNTLIITYKKPKEYMELEKIVYEEIKKITPKNEQIDDCKQS